MSESDEEEEGLRPEESNLERFICTYKGILTIQQDSNTMLKVPEEKNLVIKLFFDNINSYNILAKRNMTVFVILVAIYVIINAFHVCNIFFLGSLPLTYVKVVWLQHLFSACFCFSVRLLLPAFAFVFRLIFAFVVAWFVVVFVVVVGCWSVLWCAFFRCKLFWGRVIQPLMNNSEGETCVSL